jgi:hypothetical protein
VRLRYCYFLVQPCKFAICVLCCRNHLHLYAAMHPSNFAHWSLSTARDLTLEAARDASNARKPPTRMLPSGQLKKLLDSRSERDVLEGLRRVVTVRATPPLRRIVTATGRGQCY